jgi:MinD-like ATPase involved in chromosome partitioning or flagellar assembly
VPTSLNKGRPVYLEEPNSEVSVSIRRLAQRFTGDLAEMNGSESVEQDLEPRRRKGLFRRT